MSSVVVVCVNLIRIPKAKCLIVFPTSGRSFHSIELGDLNDLLNICHALANAWKVAVEVINGQET